MIAAENQSDFLDAICNFLGILGTGCQTLAAPNAGILYNMCLAACEAYLFYGTAADTFMAVFAVGFLQLYNVMGIVLHVTFLPPHEIWEESYSQKNRGLCLQKPNNAGRRPVH